MLRHELLFPSASRPPATIAVDSPGRRPLVRLLRMACVASEPRNCQWLWPQVTPYVGQEVSLQASFAGSAGTVSWPSFLGRRIPQGRSPGVIVVAFPAESPVVAKAVQKGRTPVVHVASYVPMAKAIGDYKCALQVVSTGGHCNL